MFGQDPQLSHRRMNGSKREHSTAKRIRIRSFKPKKMLSEVEHRGMHFWSRFSGDRSNASLRLFSWLVFQALGALVLLILQPGNVFC